MWPILRFAIWVAYGGILSRFWITYCWPNIMIFIIIMGTYHYWHILLSNIIDLILMHARVYNAYILMFKFKPHNRYLWCGWILWRTNGQLFYGFPFNDQLRWPTLRKFWPKWWSWRRRKTLICFKWIFTSMVLVIFVHDNYSSMDFYRIITNKCRC